MVTFQVISGRALANPGGPASWRAPNASRERQDADHAPALDQSDPPATAAVAFGTNVAELVVGQPIELPSEVDLADPGLGVQILLNNLLTYRDLEATFSAIGHPRIQAHWGSGVVFTNVQMLPFQYP